MHRICSTPDVRYLQLFPLPPVGWRVSLGYLLGSSTYRQARAGTSAYPFTLLQPRRCRGWKVQRDKFLPTSCLAAIDVKTCLNWRRTTQRTLQMSLFRLRDQSYGVHGT